MDLGTKDSSIFFELICSNGGGISPLNSPQAQSAGTIKVEIWPGNAFACCQAWFPNPHKSSTLLDLPTQLDADLARLSKSEVNGALYLRW